ncbi:MAG: hypothetical protein CMM93_09020 [Rickettsiales bacterium]|nr:hypothetical protein [Rickettsiales bacterium]
MRPSFPGSLRPSFWPEAPEVDPERTRKNRRAAWADAWRARPTTFAIHLVGLGLASWPAWVLRNGLRRAAGPAPIEQGVLLDVLRQAKTSGVLAATLAAFGALAVALALSVPLQMTWMAALGGAAPRDALRRGLRRSGVAMAVSVAVVGLTAVMVAVCAIPVYVVHAATDGPDARLHDLLVLASLVIPLGVSLMGLAWLDLARAAALRHGTKESLKRGWWSLRDGGGTFLWVLGARLALGLPLLLLPIPPLAAVVVLQLAALAGTFLRSRWLAEARRHVMERGVPVVPRAPRLPVVIPANE